MRQRDLKRKRTGYRGGHIAIESRMAMGWSTMPHRRRLVIVGDKDYYENK
jgi:hypothetical protein